MKRKIIVLALVLIMLLSLSSPTLAAKKPTPKDIYDTLAANFNMTNESFKYLHARYPNDKVLNNIHDFYDTVMLPNIGYAWQVYGATEVMKGNVINFGKYYVDYDKSKNYLTVSAQSDTDTVYGSYETKTAKIIFILITNDKRDYTGEILPKNGSLYTQLYDRPHGLLYRCVIDGKSMAMCVFEVGYSFVPPALDTKNTKNWEVFSKGATDIALIQNKSIVVKSKDLYFSFK